MNLPKFLDKMARNARAISALVVGISPEQARWRPDPDSWSVLEVVNHLFDEEREDFRVRLEIILTSPDRPWPEIDPQGWVTTRAYNQRELPESLGRFLDEREKSLGWLRSLPSPDWNVTCDAPWGGQISAGDLFAAWVAHDLLHTRQLVELNWFYTRKILVPYKVDYAGDW